MPVARLGGRLLEICYLVGDFFFKPPTKPFFYLLTNISKMPYIFVFSPALSFPFGGFNRRKFFEKKLSAIFVGVAGGEGVHSSPPSGGS